MIDLSMKKADTCFCRYYDRTSDGQNLLAREVYKKSLYCEEEVWELLLGMIGNLPEEAGDVAIGMSVWKGLYANAIIQEQEFDSHRKENIFRKISFFICSICFMRSGSQSKKHRSIIIATMEHP